MNLHLKKNDRELASVNFTTAIESTVHVTSVVSIETFGKLLCSLHATDRQEFIITMAGVSELSGAPWRHQLDKPEDEYEEALDYLRKKLKNIADNYGLEYTEE